MADGCCLDCVCLCVCVVVFGWCVVVCVCGLCGCVYKPPKYVRLQPKASENEVESRQREGSSSVNRFAHASTEMTCFHPQ